MASQITSLTTVYSIFSSGADQRKHQSFASLAFVRGIHKWPVNSPHKGPVTRKMFPFDDVIMCWSTLRISHLKVYFVKQLSQRFSQTCSGRYVLRFSLVVLQQNNLQVLVGKTPLKVNDIQLKPCTQCLHKMDWNRPRTFNWQRTYPFIQFFWETLLCQHSVWLNDFWSKYVTVF